MRTHRHRFTVAEIAVATGLITILFAALVPLTMFTVRSLKDAQTVAFLEQKMLLSKEQLKKDLATTSRSMVLMYPGPGEGPLGFSMPVLQRAPGITSLPLDGTGDIAWNKTVIYHVFENSATGYTELRRTVFQPRDNGLSAERRLEQLQTTIQEGGGSHEIHGESYKETRVLADNLAEYTIQAGLASVDAYASVNERSLFQLGTWILQPGNNDFLFRIVGKAPRAKDYNMCLDLLAVSPTGKGLEAEALLSDSVYDGGVARSRLMNHRSYWSDNRALYFDATGEDSFINIKIYNDMWLESTFVENGASTELCEVLFDSELGENILQMAGARTSWEARIQTRVVSPSASTSDYADSTVRVVVSNVDPVTGGNLAYGGSGARIRFQALPDAKMDIAEAWIMERISGFNGDTGTLHRLTFQDVAASGTGEVYNEGKSVVISGGIVESDLVDLPISSEKDYLVSLRFGAAAEIGSVAEWHDASGTIHAACLSEDINGAASSGYWGEFFSSSGAAAIEYVPAVASIYVTYPPRSSYTSAILDTKLKDPSYKTLDWAAVTPAGTAVTLRIRAGSMPDLSDGAQWSEALEVTGTSLPAEIKGLSGRYVQWQAVLTSEAPGLYTAKLKHVAVKWLGEKRGCDVAVIGDRGPAMGIFQLYVNGRSPAPATLALDFTLAAKGYAKEFYRQFSISSFPQNSF
ncbi:MAG: hypothetical protein K9N51_06660 [Candidatus Pacebacteria bacterium]|nr:hypothetical protein [Candidatus Paceibacterota bacterium]